MRSIDRSTSAQVQPKPVRAARLYFGTSGVDLIDQALSLEWMLTVLLEYVREHGEDVAVWMREEGDTPRLIASVIAQAHSSAEVKMI